MWNQRHALCELAQRRGRWFFYGGELESSEITQVQTDACVGIVLQSDFAELFACMEGA